jgi:acyl carrier protein
MQKKGSLAHWAMLPPITPVFSLSSSRGFDRNNVAGNLIEEIEKLFTGFDLGGQSFLAFRLAAEISKYFGAQLPLSSLFRHATIREQARLLTETTGEA